MPTVKSVYTKALIALILISTAVLMACGGDASGPASIGAANNAIPSPAQSASGVRSVSLSMDDYLGGTVVLYFSLPG